MPEERIRRFAEKAGLRSPYFVTEWNGWKVYDSPCPPPSPAERTPPSAMMRSSSPEKKNCA